MITYHYNGNPISITDNTITLTPYTWLSNGKFHDEDIVIFFFNEIKNSNKKVNVIDIGAQTGLFTLMAKYLPNATFYAFEPYKPSYDCLVDNIKLNEINNVKVFDIGLSFEKGETILNVPDHKGLCTIGTNSTRFTQFNEEIIRTDTLDNLFDDISVDFIKIDTEGWEYFILKGGLKIIEKYKPKILMEYNETNMNQCNYSSKDMNKLIADMDYKIIRSFCDDIYISYNYMDIKCFEYNDAIDINKARIDNLRLFDLNFKGKSILETGCGPIGAFTSYLEESTDKVISIDARNDLIEIHKTRFPNRKDRLFVVDLDKDKSLEQFDKFDIIFCYGTLYHLSNPIIAIKNMAEKCNDLMIVCTIVNNKDNGEINYISEDKSCPNQSFSGTGCRPSRNWLFKELRKYFKYVYIANTLPNFRDYVKEYPNDYPCPRSIFIGSQTEINNKLFDPNLY